MHFHVYKWKTFQAAKTSGLLWNNHDNSKQKKKTKKGSRNTMETPRSALISRRSALNVIVSLHIKHKCVSMLSINIINPGPVAG